MLPCATLAAGDNAPVWVPQRLPVAADAAGRRLSMYSNGRLSVLGPSGWACSALVAGDGGENLFVYPPGAPDPNGIGAQSPQPPYVELMQDYTGHGPGQTEICPYFPASSAARSVRARNPEL